jgi:hypothetical protein
MIEENNTSIIKGFAIFLDSWLVTTQRDMLRDTVYHKLCHTKLWMEDCPEEDSHGSMFLKTYDDVVRYLNTIGWPLIFKLKEINWSIDGSGEYKPLLQTKRKAKENVCDNRQKRR